MRKYSKRSSGWQLQHVPCIEMITDHSLTEDVRFQSRCVSSDCRGGDDAAAAAAGDGCSLSGFPLAPGGLLPGTEDLTRSRLVADVQGLFPATVEAAAALLAVPFLNTTAATVAVAAAAAALFRLFVSISSLNSLKSSLPSCIIKNSHNNDLVFELIILIDL